jgi:small subunit ribosomal protein S2
MISGDEESRSKTGEILMSRVTLKQLIEAGAHFGHLTSRWNPKMKPYIFMEKNGIHIIDLRKTVQLIDKAADALYSIVSQGKGVLFVGTKKQAKTVIATEARRANSNWVSERWLGGMLTNFQTIKKSITRLHNIDKMESDGTFEKMTKKEVLKLSREREKLRKVLEGVENMQRLPGALFIVDIRKEAIAVQEAHRLNIPIFAIVDTNCDPDVVDYPIPANDDAARTIELITKTLADVVLEGQAKAEELKAELKAEEEKEKKISEDTKDKRKRPRIRKVRLDGKEKKGGKGSKKPARKTEEVKKEETQAEETTVKEEVEKTEPKAEEPKAEKVENNETESKETSEEKE